MKKPMKNNYYLCKYMISKCGDKVKTVPKVLYWEDNLWLVKPNSFEMVDSNLVLDWVEIPNGFWSK